MYMYIYVYIYIYIYTHTYIYIYITFATGVTAAVHAARVAKSTARRGAIVCRVGGACGDLLYLGSSRRHFCTKTENMWACGDIPFIYLLSLHRGMHRGVHRGCASGVCIGVCIPDVHQGCAHQGVHRHIHVITASGYASGMHRVYIGHESGMRRGTHQVITLVVELGTGVWAHAQLLSELELEPLLSSPRWSNRQGRYPKHVAS